MTPATPLDNQCSSGKDKGGRTKPGKPDRESLELPSSAQLRHPIVDATRLTLLQFSAKFSVGIDSDEQGPGVNVEQ